MQARLVYNPNARGGDTISPEQLKEALRQAGYQPIYQATHQEEDLDPILEDVTEDLIVVAGGDGTVRAVATRVIEQGVPLCLLPLGSANNVAHTLGLDGAPLEIIAALKNPRRVYFDVGYVSSPWGESYFLEGAGWGFFTDTLVEYDPSDGMSVLRSISAALKTLADYEGYHCQMWLDGQDISGNYLLVEILNTTTVGPHLPLAPEASAQDGLLNMVRIEENSRDSFFNYLSNLVQEKLDELTSVITDRGRKLELTWTGFPLHVDAVVQPSPELAQNQNHPAADQSDREKTITIEIKPKALEFWLPAFEEEHS